MSGSVTEDRFWSETWTSADRVLRQLADWLRRSRAVRTIEIDEGWSRRSRRQRPRRPLGVARRARARRGARRRQGALRISTHLRPTTFGVVTAVALGGGAARRRGRRRRAALAAGRRDRRGAHASRSSRVVAWRTAQTTAIVRRGDQRGSRSARHDRDAVRPGAACRCSRRRCCGCTACAAR